MGGSRNDGREATFTGGEEGTSSVSYQPAGGDAPPIIIQKHLFDHHQKEPSSGRGIASIGAGLGAGIQEGQGRDVRGLGQAPPGQSPGLRPMRLCFEDTDDSMRGPNANSSQAKAAKDEQ